MPHDYRDFEDRPPPFNDLIASEEGVNASGAGYTVPGTSGYTVRGYKSTAVTVDGNGTTVSVEVGWKQEGQIGGMVAKETKTGGGSAPVTLLFVNQGQTLDHIKLTGGADVDYVAKESNQLPLPPSQGDPWPAHQIIPPSIILGFGDISGAAAIVVDAATWSNHFLQVTGLNAYFAFAFKMGPRYARHEVILSGRKGPDHGIVKFWIASLRPDLQSDLGAVNPLSLIQDRYIGTPAVNWIYSLTTRDDYAAAVQRNIVYGINWRVSGEIGTDATAVGVDADGHPFINGGSGIYALKAEVIDKNPLSTGYKMGFSEIGVHRIDNVGFP